MQREHMDLRTRLTDQKTTHIKQLADKDSQIEQLRVIINNLKVTPAIYEHLYRSNIK